MRQQTQFKQQEKNATEKEIVNSERVLGEINSELRDAKRDAAIAELFETTTVLGRTTKAHRIPDFRIGFWL